MIILPLLYSLVVVQRGGTCDNVIDMISDTLVICLIISSNDLYKGYFLLSNSNM